MKYNYNHFSFQTSLRKRSTKDILMLLFLGMFLFSGLTIPGVYGNTTKNEANTYKEPFQDKKISGTVIDEEGVPLPGATVTIKGTTKGVITGADGKFNLTVDQGDILIVSFIGKETQEIPVGEKEIFYITMGPQSEELEDVTVVAFAKQKKESVIASITTVRPDDLKLPSSNLTNSLAGRMSGVISYQRSGEPGEDNAQFFVRGVTTFGYKKEPLILIDGVELTSADLARVQPDDIASFSIMKDATATSLYGARGANGVIYVTTKEGKEGKAKVELRYETSISKPTQTVDIADPITYMQLHNEAVKTRDPLGILPYSLEKVDKTIEGADPILYPITDWYDELFKKQTINHRLNFNVSGGGKVARYYLAATMNRDFGVFKVDNKNNFNNNIDLKKYNLRANINLNLTETTKAKFIFNTTLDDYTGPIDGGNEMYRKVMRANPVLFRPYYEPDERNAYTNHVLFGNYGSGNYLNPYADMVKGYKDYSKNKVLAQFEVSQDLGFLAEGLTFRAMANANRYSFFDVRRAYSPFFYKPIEDPLGMQHYLLSELNVEDGTEWLDYNPGEKEITTSLYLESVLQYNTMINEKHGLSGMLVFTTREELIANSSIYTLQLSLPYRNMGLSGRFTYSYDDRYFAELNFGYNGSERFSEAERFGFFPSAGFGWLVSNENFLKDNSVVTNLKLKATYGLVGNDAIGSAYDRFFYLSQVEMDADYRGATFGKYLNYSKSGVAINRYSNPLITWETSKKLNIGLELGLFEKINLQADIFRDYTYNILDDRIILASMGLESSVRANVGEALSKGIDVSLDYSHFFTNTFWIQARGNFTYAHSEIINREEPDYSETPWMSRIGWPINQTFGYIAERLFVDQAEVDNSPEQTFGEYTGGDIKYRDINGDDRISGLDMVAIGYPTSPEIVYGIGLTMGYKAFDFSCFFQGLGRESFWMSPYWTAPFLDLEYGSTEGNNQLIKAYADSYWSEDNRDVNALWPRLSTETMWNNNVTSTHFMRNGAFVRLKQVEFGYNLPKNLVAKAKLSSARIYFSGVNLLTFSKFKLWDPEMGADGLGYPIQMVMNGGVQLSF